MHVWFASRWRATSSQVSAESATLRTEQSWCVPLVRSVPVDAVVEAPGTGMSFQDSGKPGPVTEDGSAVMTSWVGGVSAPGHRAVARRGRQARGVSRGGLRHFRSGGFQRRQGEKRGGETAAQATGGRVGARGEENTAVGGERGGPAHGPGRAAGYAAPVGGSVGLRRGS